MHKKIKVVFVINNFLVGGVERLLFDIISNFDKEKFDIKIVTILGSGPMESSFKGLGFPIYFAGPSSVFSRKLPFKLYWLMVAPITLIRITLFFFKSKPNIVVSSLFQADILSMIASKITCVKERIIIQHDIANLSSFRSFLKKKFSLNYSTQIIAVSDTVKNFLIENYKVKSEKIITIYNGIDYDYFKKGEKLNSNFTVPIIGIIGRLEVAKGHIYILEALNILKDKYNLSPAVLFAGDGSIRCDLEKYISRNHINSVKFLGNVSNVPDFLSKVDIIIVPSIEEGFGLVVLEAMVSGKVIIASDINAIRELITDGQNGLLFKSKNSDFLAEILLKALNNKDLCEKLERNALVYSKENIKLFNIQEVSNKYQNLLISKHASFI